MSQVTSLVSLSHLLSGQGLESLASAKKAVQLFPAVADNWVVLLAAVLGRIATCPTAVELLWLKKNILHVKTHLEVAPNLAQWLSSCEQKVGLLIDKVLA